MGVDAINAMTMREKVFILEEGMKKFEQTELPIKHYFAPGVYAREMFIPADTVLTGHVHKYENFNILSQGEMTVSTEEGMKRVKAPFAVVSPPGTKRIAYAHTDCVWTTIHGTNERDLAIIEETFIAKSEQEYLEHCKMLGAS